jgi:RecA/RadA recombinase
MSQALRKLTATISKTNTICIFINQLREKIGVMFGNPETTTGGNALKVLLFGKNRIYDVLHRSKMAMKQ